MCRIASLFLLQRLKGSMSGNPHDFNNIETWAVIKSPPAKQGTKGNSCHSDRNIRGTYTIVCHCQKLDGPVQMWWFFHLWCSSSWTTQNSDHPWDYWSNSRANLGRPPDFGHISTEQLGILRERVGSIIHEDLDMRKFSVKWVPKCLNADQKRQWCQSSEQLLEFLRRDPNDFLSQLVTMDETWLYHYDPETKKQSVEWQHSGSPHPKKFWVQKSAGKVLASIFWDQDGILLIDYLLKGQTINAEYYSSLLMQLKDILKEKCHGKVTKRVLFLHNSALAHQALATW